MNKKLRYFLILLFTVVSFSINSYSKTINNNTYKGKNNAILVSTHNSNSNNNSNTSNTLSNTSSPKNKFKLASLVITKEKSKIPKYLIPVGNTVGIKVNTDGVLVLGTGYINTPNGELVIPVKDKVLVGDIIFKVNGESIQTKEQLAEITSNSEKVDLVLYRNNEIKNVSIEAKKSVIDDKFKIGLWVRDTTQGIGTISFINPETNEYYALGHGILDVDTKELMKVKDGEVLACDITSINKGEKGLPGEIVGEIKVGKPIGTVKNNTHTGVKGEIVQYSNLTLIYDKIETCQKEDVEIGEAYILSNVESNGVKQYKINILQIDTKSTGNKNMVIEITDKQLLDTTGGIIQGMSGSPIIQNGKIVGAVTHVFVNNPKKGYAVFVENMINE